jgi:hypothetical protein
MWPLFREGDAVLVVPGDITVRRGDVVVCRRWGRLVAHRVLRVDRSDLGTAVITKGDNTGYSDPPWGILEMVGRVRAFRRGSQFISLETLGWRTIGWLIATVTLVWIRLDRSSQAVKRRLLGSRPNCFTVVLRRSALACSTLVLHGVDVLFCRWKP